MGEERINVCYGMTDIMGTYSKFVGTSICSVCENTASPVTVHLIHDHTLTECNMSNFQKLVGQYGQKIVFYDVNVSWGSVWKKLKEELLGLDGTRFAVGMFYRLVIGSLLADENRAIYLDADTIVNLDIRELWEYEIPVSGLAAVPDMVIQELGDNVINSGVVRRESYFNSGVLLLDLEKIRGMGNIVDKVVKFILQYYPDYPDQDALNHLFPYSAILPSKYNTFVNMAADMHRPIGSCIYHYVGNCLSLDMSNEYNGLYFRYFIKTPWFDEIFLGNFVKNIEYLRLEMIAIANRCAGKRRIIIGPASRHQELVEFFSIGGEDVFIASEEMGERSFDFSRMRDLILIMVPESDYAGIRKKLLGFGLVEDVDFIYLPPRIGMDKFMTSEYGMFSNS